jgi:hypothetical protein
MSQSDFDLLAVDESGRPTNGVSEPSPCGVQVEVFHNWLNIRDRTGWREGALTPVPIVGTFLHGELTYQDVTLLAVRGPQEGIYFVTWFTDSRQVYATLGIGCHGWVQEGPVRGSPQIPVYRGILPSSLEFLNFQIQEWLSQQRIPVSLARVSLEQAMRFNQGDAFVTRGANFPVPCTRPGEASPPLALEWLKAQQPPPPDKESSCSTASSTGGDGT